MQWVSLNEGLHDGIGGSLRPLTTFSTQTRLNDSEANFYPDMVPPDVSNSTATTDGPNRF